MEGALPPAALCQCVLPRCLQKCVNSVAPRPECLSAEVKHSLGWWAAFMKQFLVGVLPYTLCSLRVKARQRQCEIVSPLWMWALAVPDLLLSLFYFKHSTSLTALSCHKAGALPATCHVLMGKHGLYVSQLDGLSLLYFSWDYSGIALFLDLNYFSHGYCIWPHVVSAYL